MCTSLLQRCMLNFLLVSGCRKWPTAHSFQPRLLDSVTSATIDAIIANHCKVLWAPAADTSSQASARSDASGNGKWVAPSGACMVQPSDQKASSVIINVARRAGLYIPDVPSHVYQASRSRQSLRNCSRALLNSVDYDWQPMQRQVLADMVKWSLRHCDDCILFCFLAHFRHLIYQKLHRAVVKSN